MYLTSGSMIDKAAEMMSVSKKWIDHNVRSSRSLKDWP
jgi:hypothetical protein